MPIPLVVPDASVLLKWVLPPDEESDADKARLLRAAILDETVRALLPPLWFYEVGNTIARRFPAQAVDWLSALMKFRLEEAPPSRPWLAKILELTGRYEASFYDAAYHALALIYRGVFVTADIKYINKVKEAGSIVALGEWQLPQARRTKSKRRR
jgi:predicted nucleic acid-binding protein